MRKYRLNKIKFIKFMGMVVILLIVMWFATSYGEVLAKNLNGNVQLTSWNFFNVFMK